MVASPRATSSPTALTDSLLQDQTFADYEITEPEARCAAERVVDDLGTDRLVEIGFANDKTQVDFTELDESEITVLADAMNDCIDDSAAVLVDAVAAGILEEPDPAFPVNDQQAHCVAQGVVDQVGLSRLIVVGVESQRNGGDQFAALEPEEVDAFTNAFVDCIDVRKILLDNIAASGAGDDVIACLDANITDDDIAELFAAGFAGEDSAAAAERILQPAVDACT